MTSTTVLFLLCLISTDMSRQDTPTLYMDGYIEINHFWADKSFTLDGKDIQLGYCVFDQILIWQYDPIENRYNIFHWEMIPNGREINRIPHEFRQEYKDVINQRQIRQHKWSAWRAGLSVEDIIVYMDSPWMGERTGMRRPEYNFASQKWEVVFTIADNNHKFVVPTLVETNTLFDPDVEYRNAFDKPNGSTKFSGVHRPKKKAKDANVSDIE